MARRRHTRRHIQAVRLMLPKIPESALGTVIVCAAACTADATKEYMA